MMQTSDQSKKIVMYIIGVLFVITGTSLTLSWWDDVVVLFRGVIGMVLAVGGLVVLYLARE